MSLPDAVSKALETRAKLLSSNAANEANTKALLIEPLLDALGWDPWDLDVVEREVKVYDGTFLDYGLKVDGQSRLYVEAKAVGENLSEKKFVAQTVNYANNDGVVWCVLTNGIGWRVFKTNESAEMSQKLLFEVDLSDESQTVADMSKLFKLIGRDSVASGELDRYGERVFTDGRVRGALSELASDPPKVLTDAVAAKLGHPAVPTDALRRSLARIFDVPPNDPKGSQPKPPGGTGTKSGGVGPPQPPSGHEYPLDHHLGTKSALINELFSEVNSFALALGPDVSRRVRKFYVGYFRGKKSFFTMEAQKQKIWVYLNLDPSNTRPWDEQAMRDVRKIGHYGMGDTEYSLSDHGQLAAVTALVKLAYDRTT